MALFLGLVVTWRFTGDSATAVALATLSGRIPTDATLNSLVGEVAASLMLVAVAGLAVVLGLSAGAVLLQGRSGRLPAVLTRITPACGRRLIAVCCGMGLAAPGMLGGAALAENQGRPLWCLESCQRPGLALGGLPLPDLPTVGRAGTAGSAGPADSHRTAGPAESARIVVRRGDSLWTIAAALLPSAATASDIAALTDRLYRLNAATIGRDRDLILPGMILTAPKGTP